MNLLSFVILGLDPRTQVNVRNAHTNKKEKFTWILGSSPRMTKKNNNLDPGVKPQDDKEEPEKPQDDEEEKLGGR